MSLPVVPVVYQSRHLGSIPDLVVEESRVLQVNLNHHHDGNHHKKPTPFATLQRLCGLFSNFSEQRGQ